MSEIACTSWEVDGYEVLRHWQEAADPALRDEAKRRAAAAVAGIDVADQIAEAVTR